ncbi:hypothetical protein [Cupriavidus nantongensis]|uniref:Uncharacterized protein n=1 Tax=Cupriavidus nantongensis TaxID=1796606 RepID=A0A142JKF2_9BURK|nr:hypothetical protein [Cupriavidus nantongensis]AMR78564.1 hypothetical protein A2G96_12890 [Cupriavidus nantongensis]
MSLDENIDLTRKLQHAGQTLVRLSRYGALGITPSRDNLQKAADYFESISAKLEPILKSVEATKSVQRVRPLGMRG